MTSIFNYLKVYISAFVIISELNKIESDLKSILDAQRREAKIDEIIRRGK